MEEMLIWALIVAEMIIIGIALYITFKAEEFHKNEKAYNNQLKELLDEERANNKVLFDSTKDLANNIAYLTHEVMNFVKGEKQDE